MAAGKPITSAQIGEIRQLQKQGLSKLQISKKMGLGHNAVQRYWRKTKMSIK